MSGAAEVVRIGIRKLTARVGVCSVTIWRWVRLGAFPPPEYLGAHRTWRVDVVEQWERERVAQPRRRAPNLRPRRVATPENGATPPGAGQGPENMDRPPPVTGSAAGDGLAGSQGAGR